MKSSSRRAPAAFRPAAVHAAVILALASAAAHGEDGAQLVVVTAARTEQSLPDALPSTRVITRQEIEQSQSVDLTSLLRSLTSADVAQTGPLGSQTSVFLRGGDSRQTLVLVDGVPINRADFGMPSFQFLPIDEIERIEIVRGNVSALYGSQAVGGVIQIFTRRATKPEVTVGAGERGSWNAAAAAGTQWGEGDQVTRLSASLSARGTEGFSAADPNTSPGANPDRDGASQRGANLRVTQGWAAGHQTVVSLLSSRTRSDYDGYSLTPQHDVLTTTLNVLGINSRHALAPSLQLGVDLGATRERFDDPTGFTINGRNRVQQAGAQLQWDVAADQLLQGGIERKSERFDDNSGVQQKRDTDVLRLGWIGKAWHRFEWQLHVRSDRSGDYGRETTGLVALGYALTPEWKLSAQAGNAFNAPTFVDQQYADPAAPLKPERSRDAELAVQWARGTQLVRAAVFAQRQHDRIDFDPVTFAAMNIARSRNTGLEVIGQLDAGPGRLAAELTLQDPRNADTDERLLRRARHSLSLNYRLPVGAWQLGAALRHTGERVDFDPATFANASNPARTTLDLTTQWQINPTWRVGAKLENAGNTRTPEVLGYTPAPRSFSLQLVARMP